MENNNFNKGGYVNNRPNFNDNAPKTTSDVCVETPQSTTIIEKVGGWETVGKTAGVAAGVALVGYGLYRGFKWGCKKMFGKNNSKEEAPATKAADSKKKEEQFEEAK